MQTLKQRLQHLEQDAYWEWLGRYLYSLTNEQLLWLYDAVESAPEETGIEELNGLLRNCQQH